MNHNPLMTAYILMVLVLCCNLLFLWGYSGLVRVRSKIVINAEDAATVAKGASTESKDPPEVARVLRVHANAMATCIPFVLLAWLFVISGGKTLFGQIDFAVFVVARLVHTVAYLRAQQPMRTISFVIGMVATLVLLANVVWLTIQS